MINMLSDQNKIICPDCKTEIKKPNEVSLGDVLECPQCGTEVQILSTDPLKYGELIEEK
ncbi:MAG: lysine biosynthesis protein LysW [Candidatus Shapirobacteria bacterium]|jgi:lysine biosynthesis protein LysW